MCYRDAGNSGGATCNIIIPTGRQDGTAGLAKGTPIVVNNVNSGPTYFHSVAYIAPKGKAILCYQVLLLRRRRRHGRAHDLHV